MALIDHLVYSVPDLDAGSDWFEKATGTRPEVGGAHPGIGTHNALVSLGECYLELIAPDPNQPAPARPRPFGLDERSDSQLVAFAVRPSAGESIEELAIALRRNGHDPGPVEVMRRRTPAGTTLSWMLTTPGASDEAVPFLIDWGVTPRPDTTAVAGPRLVELVVRHPSPSSIAPLYEALDLTEDASGPRLVDDTRVSLSAHLAGDLII